MIGGSNRLARSSRLIMELGAEDSQVPGGKGYGVDDGEVGRAEDRVVGEMERGVSVGQVI